MRRSCTLTQPHEHAPRVEVVLPLIRGAGELRAAQQPVALFDLDARVTGTTFVHLALVAGEQGRDASPGARDTRGHGCDGRRERRVGEQRITARVGDMCDKGAAPPARSATCARCAVCAHEISAIHAVVHAHAGEPVVAGIPGAGAIELGEQVRPPATDLLGFRWELRHALVVPPAVSSEADVAPAAGARSKRQQGAAAALERRLRAVGPLQIACRVRSAASIHSLRSHARRGGADMECNNQQRQEHGDRPPATGRSRSERRARRSPPQLQR